MIILQLVTFLIFAHGSFTQDFDVDLIYQPNWIENSESTIEIKPFPEDSSITCTYTVKRPDNSVIKSGADDFISITSNDIGIVTEDIEATINVVCEKSSKTLEFSAKVKIFDADGSMTSLQVDYALTLSRSTQDTTENSISFENRKEQIISCQITLDDNSAATLSTSSISTETSADFKVTKSSTTETTFINLACTQNGKTLNNKIPIVFKTSADPYASAGGDPHFRQPVIDQSTGLTKDICYDVTGERQDYIYISGFNRNNLKVYGQLKDDYYMHKIFIQSLVGNITITENFVILDDKQIYVWGKEKKNIQTNQFEYLISEDEISVKTANDLSFKLPLNILIKKGAHSMSEVHLDVGFKYPLSEYPQMTGLFGKIGNQRITFYNNVQEAEDVNEMTSILINGELINAEKVIRSNSQCYLVDVKHLLKPAEINEFLLKSL